MPHVSPRAMHRTFAKLTHDVLPHLTPRHPDIIGVGVSYSKAASLTYSKGAGVSYSIGAGVGLVQGHLGGSPAVQARLGMEAEDTALNDRYHA